MGVSCLWEYIGADDTFSIRIGLSTKTPLWICWLQNMDKVWKGSVAIEKTLEDHKRKTPHIRWGIVLECAGWHATLSLVFLGHFVQGNYYQCSVQVLMLFEDSLLQAFDYLSICMLVHDHSNILHIPDLS